MNIHCVERKQEYEYRHAVSRFTEFIRQRESRFFGHTGLPATWYRGQRNKDWDLLPTILRNPVLDAVEREMNEFSLGQTKLSCLLSKERTLLLNFKREGASLTDRLLRNKEWYYKAQHYGLYTRLLDWTKNPRIALWFAIQPDENGEDSTDGCLYTINPKDYRQYNSPSCGSIEYTSHEIREIEKSYIEWIFGFTKDMELTEAPDILPQLLRKNPPRNDEDRKSLEKVALEHKDAFWDIEGKVLAIYPDWYNERQASQSSFFTLHLPDKSNPNKPVREKSKIIVADGDKLVIPRRHKRFLRAFLSIEGMRRWNVFPDFDHLAKGLNDEIIGIDADN